MADLSTVGVFDALCRHAARTSNSGMRYAELKKDLNVPDDETMKLRNALRKLRDKELICNGKCGWQLDKKGLATETFREMCEFEEWKNDPNHS